MNIILLYRLRKASQKLSPAKAFKARLWRELDSAWQEHNLPSSAWYQTHWFRLSLVALAGLAAVGSFGTGVFAYSSPAVTENTPLYPVKRILERVEEKLRHAPEAKAEFYLKQADRREVEKVVLEQRHQNLENVERQINIVDEELEETSKQLEKMEVKDARLRLRIKERLEKRRERLERRFNR